MSQVGTHLVSGDDPGADLLDKSRHGDCCRQGKRQAQLHRRPRGRDRYSSSERGEKAGECFRNRSRSERQVVTIVSMKRVDFRSLSSPLSAIADYPRGAIAIFRASRSIPGICRELYEACSVLFGGVCWVVGDNNDKQSEAKELGRRCQ